MSITYFAYGANLDMQPMQERCPGAQPLQKAVLADHRLVAMQEGWLSIEAKEGSQVEGLLWELSTEHLIALDRYEDVADGLYVHTHKTVEAADGTSQHALVYVGSNSGPGVLHGEYAQRVARATESLFGSEAGHRVRALARP